MDKHTALLKITRHLNVHIDSLTEDEAAALIYIIQAKIRKGKADAAEAKPQPSRARARGGAEG